MLLLLHCQHAAKDCECVLACGLYRQGVRPAQRRRAPAMGAGPAARQGGEPRRAGRTSHDAASAPEVLLLGNDAPAKTGFYMTLNAHTGAQLSAGELPV